MSFMLLLVLLSVLVCIDVRPSATGAATIGYWTVCIGLLAASGVYWLAEHGSL